MYLVQLNGILFGPWLGKNHTDGLLGIVRCGGVREGSMSV